MSKLALKSRNFIRALAKSEFTTVWVFIGSNVKR